MTSPFAQNSLENHHGSECQTMTSQMNKKLEATEVWFFNINVKNTLNGMNVFTEYNLKRNERTFF